MYGFASFGALAGLSNPRGLGGAIAGFIVTLLLGAALLLWGVYLLRGRGDSPRAAAKKSAAQRNAANVAQVRAAQASSSVDAALAALVAASGAGAAVVAYRNLQETVRRFHPQEADAKLHEVLAAADLDLSRTHSPLLGTVRVPNGRRIEPLEVYRDFVILGQQAHDYDASTSATVFTDGQIQVTSAVVTKKNGKQQIVNQEIDKRTASFQVASRVWSLSVPILPDDANEARRLAAQITAHVETLKPTAVSALDLQQMIDTILNNTGQPPAERIQQLDALRYQRLISDDDFKAASAKILGIN